MGRTAPVRVILQGRKCLWVTVTRLATVFTIARRRSRDVAEALLGSDPDQVVGSDRFSSYAWIAARCERDFHPPMLA